MTKKMKNTTKSYQELSRLKSFEDRFDYLKLTGVVGETTFGFDRYLNQAFYRSKEWRNVRREVIVRDDGCDMGHPDHPINGRIIIHHINPVSLEDLDEGSDILLDPNNLVCVSETTHNAIHFGDSTLLPEPYVERSKNDTCPWKR